MKTLQRSRPRPLDNQHGIALAYTVLGLGAILAVTAIGVDVAHLAFSATEVQNAADVAATAGARSLFLNGAGSAQSGALLVLQQNRIDQQAAGASNLQSVEEGTYDAASNSFTPNGTPLTAVRATATATVPDLLTGMLPALIGGSFGSTTSTVTKVATASFVTLGGGAPTLPLAIGACKYVPNCYTSDCLPTLTQAPNPSDSSGWTGFTGGSGKSDVEAFFPSACGGSGATIPELTARSSDGTISGTMINLSNGQISPLVNDLFCMFCTLHIEKFIIPVIDSCQFNQTGEVLGFTTVTVTSFHFSNNKVGDCSTKGGTPDGVNLKAVEDASAPGKPGGGNYGTGFFALVG